MKPKPSKKAAKKKKVRKKPAVISVDEYYALLRADFLIGSDRSKVLQQLPARGENEEVRIAEFLRKVLPKRFSISKGFIVSSDRALGPSPHMEVVIHDEFINMPLHRELSAVVFPVETVYATVEVKRVLTKALLSKIVEDSAKVRALAKAKHYTAYTPIKHPETGNAVTGLVDFEVTGQSPRTFVVAFRQQGWKTIDALAADIDATVNIHPGHLHGVVVLESDWHLKMIAYKGPGERLKYSTGHALLTFTKDMIHALLSFQMYNVSVNKYLKID